MIDKAAAPPRAALRRPRCPPTRPSGMPASPGSGSILLPSPLASTRRTTSLTRWLRAPRRADGRSIRRRRPDALTVPAHARHRGGVDRQDAVDVEGFVPHPTGSRAGTQHQAARHAVDDERVVFMRTLTTAAAVAEHLEHGRHLGSRKPQVREAPIVEDQRRRCRSTCAAFPDDRVLGVQQLRAGLPAARPHLSLAQGAPAGAPGTTHHGRQPIQGTAWSDSSSRQAR